MPLDELLSYREELTEKERQDLIRELGDRMKAEGYPKAFGWAEEILRQYPGDEELLLYMGVMLNAYRITEKPENPQQYDEAVCGFLSRALESPREEIRLQASTSLFQLHFQKGQYEQAEKYLDYLSVQNPERKRLQASICEKTGRTEEAWRLYEELLYSYYTMVSLVLHNLFNLAQSEHDRPKLRYLQEKQADAARLFDMGEYSVKAPALELALLEQDADACLDILEQLVENVDSMDGSFRSSPLYAHMKFKEVPGKEKLDFRELLKKSLREDASLDFLKGTQRWKKLIEG